MSKINQLDIHTTNLIAAGEVIERAASVVKELVENSLDANAKNISIHLVDSGVTEIRVVDDGDGMDSIDAKMCILPHATSKIKTENDLFSISTLGFRGEALSSIVAVSNFRIITSTDGYKAIMLSFKGGIPMSEAVVAHNKGTEIIVKNLFFNTPARLQNLQSQNVELGYISDFVSKAALGNPDVAFTLINNDRVILQTYGNNDILENISIIHGNDVAKNMIQVYDSNLTYSINGFISNLSITRSNKNYIYLFINGRIVKSFNINQSIIKGYETRLMVGKFPIVVLNIEADYSIVDVNVHPTKAEVRFSDEQSLLSLIQEMIEKFLQKNDLSINMSLNNVIDNEYNSEKIDDNLFLDNSQIEDDRYDKEVQDNEIIEEEIMDAYSEVESDYESSVIESIPDDIFPVENSELETFNNDYVVEDIVSKEKEQFVQEQIDLYEDNNTSKLEKVFYIGQLFGTYILAQGEECFYVIDQHAAAERINYEKIINELEHEELICYDLLVPFNLDYSLKDFLLIKEKIDEIKKLGIELEEFGTNSFLVRRIPVWIFRGKEKEFVDEIISQIISGNKNSKTDFLSSLAKSLACKKSIKGNEFHSQMEIEYLLEDLRQTSNPYTCPHGRPIIIKFSQTEIEKWFKRIV